MFNRTNMVTDLLSPTTYDLAVQACLAKISVNTVVTVGR